MGGCAQCRVAAGDSTAEPGADVTAGSGRPHSHGDTPAAVAAIGLEDVQAAVLQIREHFENRAIPFTCCQWNRNLFLQSFEDFNVAGNGRLFDEQQVVGLDRSGQLNERRRGERAVGIEHNGSGRAHLFASFLD